METTTSMKYLDRITTTCPTCGEQYRGLAGERFSFLRTHRAHTNGARFQTIIDRSDPLYRYTPSGVNHDVDVEGVEVEAA
jgi:hypothetical protein